MTGFSFQASEGGIKTCRKKPGGLAADSDRERSERGSAGEFKLNGCTALRMMILAEMPSYAARPVKLSRRLFSFSDG
ncbi:TPA: hypothetical protein JD175_16140 [Cronobacter sakazakii]|uniref:Uncharacterized protein n=1 Tax=Cronobacter sakazakii TaxID=28141 RepID=A0AAN5WZL3_CROSK|nr:hypothetical protein [Cronobacter sakazakii]TWR30111.1 hypothetical protein FQY85_22210 [Cronobacter turicensis]EGT4353096.1 hypothetical protein [Cronobacter sakazakii]EGT5725362.1 hypothetical protein [Cronobacter sakazakii]KAB0874629.1 hypothetical protein FZI38_22925 [Cronobacter sakazakii]